MASRPPIALVLRSITSSTVRSRLHPSSTVATPTRIERRAQILVIQERRRKRSDLSKILLLLGLAGQRRFNQFSRSARTSFAAATRSRRCCRRFQYGRRCFHYSTVFANVSLRT